MMEGNENSTQRSPRQKPSSSFARKAHHQILRDQQSRDNEISQNIEATRGNLYEEIKAMRDQQGASVTKMREKFAGSGLPETLDTFFVRLIDQETRYQAKVSAAQVHRGLAGKATPAILSEFLRNLKGVEGKKEFLRIWVTQENQKGHDMNQRESEQVIFELLSGSFTPMPPPSNIKYKTGVEHIGRVPQNSETVNEEFVPSKNGRNESEQSTHEMVENENEAPIENKFRRTSFTQQWAEWQDALADETIYNSLPDTPASFFGQEAVSGTYLTKISEAKKELMLNAAFNYGTPDPDRRGKIESNPSSVVKEKQVISDATILKKYENANPGQGKTAIPPQIISLLSKKGYWFEDDDSEYSGAEDEDHEDPSLSLGTVFLSPKAPEYKIFEEEDS
mmetsp:Transcript_38543/g.49797  ORF Transcript_38543/g.49797 Transcript_38543/m.49797 type:complete len:393 (+) Transcript_38543:56-1234(+)